MCMLLFYVEWASSALMFVKILGVVWLLKAAQNSSRLYSMQPCLCSIQGGVQKWCFHLLLTLCSEELFCWFEISVSLCFGWSKWQIPDGRKVGCFMRNLQLWAGNWGCLGLEVGATISFLLTLLVSWMLNLRLAWLVEVTSFFAQFLLKKQEKEVERSRVQAWARSRSYLAVPISFVWW